MKLIQPKAELLPWSPGIEGVYKMIELAGRTCYKSLDKITDDSAKPFVDRMIASHHTAMLEHGTVYMLVSDCAVDDEWINGYAKNPYSKIVPFTNEVGNFWAVTTNLRVLVENNWLRDLELGYLSDPTEHHEMRYSFKLTTSIGVTRELNRHRVDSIAEQSTRYCNYSKDKFGGEITFCIPKWYDEHKYDSYKMNEFDKYLKQAEDLYMFYVDCGMQPQEAREILPLCTATEIVHTAIASDWRHFFDLRLFGKTGAPHPNMKQLAELMRAEAEKQGIWEDIMNQPSKF